MKKTSDAREETHQPKREWEAELERIEPMYDERTFPERYTRLNKFIKQVEDEAIRRTVMKVREEIKVEIGNLDRLSKQTAVTRSEKLETICLAERNGLKGMLDLPSLTITKEEK